MKNLESKKKYTNEDYVNYVNSIIDEDYEMYTETTIAFKTLNTGDNEKEEEIVEVPVEKNIIVHKTCGFNFEMKRDVLLSKIRNKSDICLHCKVKNRK